MAKIFITGSTDGLGMLAAKQLIKVGNDVYLHARNESRAIDARVQVPYAKEILIGDLASKSEVKNLARQMNEIGPFDTVIYNAGISSNDKRSIFKVNVLAPYMLTALTTKPKRIIYISSGMHKGAKLDLDNLENDTDYSSSKLQILMLTKVLSRKWKVAVNAVDPGWVPTKMGGPNANDDLIEGYTSQVWLATLDDPKVTGKYFYHMRPDDYDKRVDNVALQDEFLEKIASISGIKLPN